MCKHTNMQGKIPYLSIYFCQVIIWRESDAWQGILGGGGQEVIA